MLKESGQCQAKDCWKQLPPLQRGAFFRRSGERTFSLKSKVGASTIYRERSFPFEAEDKKVFSTEALPCVKILPNCLFCFYHSSNRDMLSVAKKKNRSS